MNSTTIVYIAGSALLLRPVEKIVFHLKGRSRWPTYPNGARVGEECHWTRCGRLHFDSAKHSPFLMDAIRRDNAEKMGMILCRRCDELEVKGRQPWWN